MALDSHGSHNLHEIHKGFGTADTSPTSNLSGSTVIASSCLEDTDTDNSFLGEAEAAGLEGEEQSSPLSPSVYYDDLDLDLDLEKIEYEQQRLIEAAEKEEMGFKPENRAMSPAVYYETPSPPLGTDQVSVHWVLIQNLRIESP